MPTLIAALRIGLVCSVPLGCQPKLTDAECNQLLDRYVELLVRASWADASAQDIAELQAAARVRAAQDPRFVQCRSLISRGAYQCAMEEASTADDVERCLL